MIATLTLNPGLDLTYSLDESSVGEVEVHRATTSTIEASGKGVNVSRALHLNGIHTVAVLPLGGSTGHHLAELLDAEGVTHRSTTAQTPTRINTTIALRGGDTAKVNGAGGSLSDSELEALKHEVTAALTAKSDDAEVWLAVCGSLPPGVDPETVADFVALAHDLGARCALDASGTALTAAISASADLLAPNRLELTEINPQAASARTLEELGDVAAGIARDTGAALLVSLGRDGALFTDGEVRIHGFGPALKPVNTAGAGDALLSGWLATPGTPTERMAHAIAWSRAACLATTTVAPAPSDPLDVTDPSTPSSAVTVRVLPPGPTEGSSR